MPRRGLGRIVGRVDGRAVDGRAENTASLLDFGSERETARELLWPVGRVLASERHDGRDDDRSDRTLPSEGPRRSDPAARSGARLRLRSARRQRQDRNHEGCQPRTSPS